MKFRLLLPLAAVVVALSLASCGSSCDTTFETYSGGLDDISYKATGYLINVKKVPYRTYLTVVISKDERGAFEEGETVVFPFRGSEYFVAAGDKVSIRYYLEYSKEHDAILFYGRSVMNQNWPEWDESAF